MDMQSLREERVRSFLDAVRGNEIDEAVEALFEWMITFESQDSPHCFLDAARIMGPELFWRAFHRHWSCFDRIPHRRFATVMRAQRDGWRSEFMSLECAAAFMQLPESFIAYRGQSADKPAGLSWSLSRSVAEGFARGHRLIPVRNPVVIEATIRRTAVAGIFLAREESEVVIFSAGDAKNRKIAACDKGPLLTK